MTFQFAAVRDLLRCPKSRSPLVQDGDSLVCSDPECRLRFGIRDDIPGMLIDDATELTGEEWRGVMQRCEPGSARHDRQ